ILTGVRELPEKEKFFLWKRMHEERAKAANHYNMNLDCWSQNNHPVPDLQSMWGQLAQQGHTSAIPLIKLDEIQHANAHAIIRTPEFFKKPNSEKMEDLYDLVVRPMERKYGVNMPLSAELLKAQNDSVKQTWLINQIFRIAGIEHLLRKNQQIILEELSKIRHLTAEQLSQQYSPDWAPLQRLPKLTFKMAPAPVTEAFQDNVITWSVKSEDFYPGGKLFGLYVKPDQRVPEFIIRRFTNKKLTEPQLLRFHHDLIIARCQWSQEITTQLAVQNGEVIEQNHIDMPFWLNNVTTMTELNREQAGQLAIRSIEEQLQDKNIVLEDFILGGRLATYPTEGTHILDPQILENLGIGSELTAKEGRLVTSFVNKKIKQFHRQIVLARQQQKQQVRIHFNNLTKLEKKLQKANEIVDRNLSKQQGPSKAPAAARNLFPIFNSQDQRMTRSRSRS
ncbi:MAG: hypothetical protein ACOYB0_11055, partial [Polynucleobacter sp.]